MASRLRWALVRPLIVLCEAREPHRQRSGEQGVDGEGRPAPSLNLGQSRMRHVRFEHVCLLCQLKETVGGLHL
jgi:hypothetical protein